jgi:hypothetical protein
MSPAGPTSFKFQVAQLQGELTRCIEFCQDIRANRHLEGTRNIDNLERALESAEISIPNNFNAFCRIAGSQMEAGDNRARREMSESIMDVQQNIKAHLKDIAQPRHHGRHDRQRAGFKDMLTEWESIFRSVSSTMRSLSSRIEESRAAPAPRLPEPKKKNTDDVTITMKEFDIMIEHQKNSWEEVILGGSLAYQNVFDKKRTVKDRPEGFVKLLPRATRRTSSWKSDW